MLQKKSTTIILLIRGRPKFTERWLNYANLHLNKLHIIIADGSREEEKFIIDPAKYPNLKLSIPDFEWDKDIQTYQRKILRALDLVESEYVIFTSNDDFIIYNGIKEMEKILIKDKDCSAAMGVVYDFSINSLSSDKLYGDLYSINLLFNKTSFLSENYYERLKSYALNPFGLWHSLSRTVVLKEVIKLSLKNKITEHQIFENFMSFYIVASGKVYFDNNLYMLHQVHPKMQTIDDHFENIEDVITNNQYETKIFIDTFGGILSEKYGISVLKALEITNEIFIKKYIGNRKKIKRKKLNIKKLIIKIISMNKIFLFLSLKMKFFFYKSKIYNQKEIQSIQYFLRNNVNERK